MEGGTAQPADDEAGRERRGGPGEAYQTQHRHRQEGAHHQQHARMPAIRQPAKSQLRNRGRDLVQHDHRAGGREREAQPGDQRRQEWHVQIGVGVGDEVRAGHPVDGWSE
jgi:hypothetical protein